MEEGLAKAGPSISVVITTYGDEAWRELAWSRAYPSAVAQDPFEVIVHHEPNMRIGPARNAAALLASGDYLVFLDADDELATDYLDAMREALADQPAWAIGHPSVRYIINNRARPDLLRPIGDLRHENFLVVGAAVPRDLFMQVGGFGDYDHGFEDWALWAKCWKAGARIVPVPSATYIAHMDRSSAHRTFWRNRKEQVAMHLKVQSELFPEGVS
jgi:glycosyltransferase involved in cell wall biosynthesis